jgi:hypothetical protein
MTTLEWGGVFLAVGAALYILGKLPKVQVILGFLGTCIVTGGLFGKWLTKGAVLVEHWSNLATAKAFGAAIPALPAIVLGIFLIHDLLPKNKASKRTLIVGVAFAALCVAGVTTNQTLNSVPANVRTNVSQNASTIG